MTARHVLDDEIRGDPQKVQLEDGDGWFGALYASDEIDEETGHNVGGILPMHKAYFHDALDIALLSLRLPMNTKTGKRLSLPVSRLAAGFPTVGGMCFGLGYPKMVWQHTGDGLSLDQSFMATKGVVSEVHYPWRDRVMLPFPCFRTDARFDGGMSGGPVFTEDGLVRGVVCSSVTTDGAPDEHLSYASLVAPAFAIKLEGQGEDGVTGDKFLLDFVEGGAVPASMEGVTFTQTGGVVVVNMPR